MSESLQFNVDQRIVYPSQGVGKIVDIFEKKYKDNVTQFYKIYIAVSDMIVMVPVENAAMLGIRSIVSADEAQEALDMLGEMVEPITSDWKLRYQMNLDLLKKGSIKDIASIVRSLYHRSKVKELPILERKLYDSAKKLLEDEIAFAMGKEPKEVEEMIHAKLEPLGELHTKRPIFADDEEDEDDELMDDVAADDDNADDSDDDEDDDDE